MIPLGRRLGARVRLAICMHVHSFFHPLARGVHQVVRTFAVMGAAGDPFNSTPMGVNLISCCPPHERPTGMHRTCGKPNAIKKDMYTHPEYVTALTRA